jgi:hypothetical protein
MTCCTHAIGDSLGHLHTAARAGRAARARLTVSARHGASSAPDIRARSRAAAEPAGASRRAERAVRACAHHRTQGVPLLLCFNNGVRACVRVCVCLCECVCVCCECRCVTSICRVSMSHQAVSRILVQIDPCTDIYMYICIYIYIYIYITNTYIVIQSSLIAHVS